MNLLWTSYKGKRRLLLYLAESNGKLIVLDDHHIPHDELQLIKYHHQNLDSLSVKEKMAWFKQNTPKAYRAALRTLDKKHTFIINSIKIPIAQRNAQHQTV